MVLRLHIPDPGPFSADGGGRLDRAPGVGGADLERNPAQATDRATDRPTDRPTGSLNLLLTYGGWREHAFADQIPLILDRFGIRCYRAESGDEASEVIRSARVHIAVIDLSIPMHPTRSQPPATRAVPAGPRVLQLLRRLDQPPPTIVVRPRQVDPAESTRMLADALRDGAFTVLDDPVPIEAMLQALERVVRRHYRDHWPAA